LLNERGKYSCDPCLKDRESFIGQEVVGYDEDINALATIIPSIEILGLITRS
jgi:hypothetical protein